jgi:2-polyprenyl-3-methyl-5-hydroxy-6-metoxy-1,4-benzoquinol methylase
MTENRQALADVPLQTKGRLWNAQSIGRYWARKVAFGIPALRSVLEKGQVTSEKAAAHLDAMMSQTHFSTYLGGTISVDASNAMTATLIKYHAAPEPSVLDIGCCGGTLLSSLSSFSRYLGTDISAHAIGVARSDPELTGHIASGRAAFEVGDLRSFEPEGVWNVIVLNEVLYYLGTEQAVAETGRFAKHLAPGGILCVTMIDDAKSAVIFRKLTERYNWIDGMLWQRKATGLSFGIRVNRERPAHLLGILSARGS